MRIALLSYLHDVQKVEQLTMLCADRSGGACEPGRGATSLPARRHVPWGRASVAPGRGTA